MRPGEAHRLAAAAGYRLRCSTLLLQLLLRLSRGDDGDLPVDRGTKWLAVELDYSTESIKHARRELTRTSAPACESCAHPSCLLARGFVSLAHVGTGRTRTWYRLDVAALRVMADVVAGVYEVPEPVAVDLFAAAAEDEDEPLSEDQEEELAAVAGGVATTPLGGSHYPPGGSPLPPHTRARVLFSPVPGTTPPTPTAQVAAVAAETALPDDVGAPQQTDAKCPHGRTVAQGGCRPCGTTPRQLEAKRTKAAAAAERAAAAARRAEGLSLAAERALADHGAGVAAVRAAREAARRVAS